MPESTRPDDDATETALRMDPRLTEPQKRALLACVPQLYRSRTVMGQRTIRRIV